VGFSYQPHYGTVPLTICVLLEVLSKWRRKEDAFKNLYLDIKPENKEICSGKKERYCMKEGVMVVIVEQVLQIHNLEAGCI